MVTANKKTGKKVQRTPRNRVANQDNDGVSGSAYYPCDEFFRKEQWCLEENGSERNGGHEIVCPACRRIADRNPEGIVVLSRDFYAAYESEILNQINKTARDSGTKNQRGMVMDIHIHKEKDSVTITTTDVKLAQKIGRDYFNRMEVNCTTPGVLPIFTDSVI